MDLSLARQAASRFAALQGTPDNPQSPTAPAVAPGEKRRLTRLNRIAATQVARSTALAADASTATGTQSDVLASISQERVIGKSDLKDFDFVELAIAVGRCVGRVRIPNGFGTGFLVGPNLMMTNHHVLADRQTAAAAHLQLDYQDDRSGTPLPVHSFRLQPEQFFFTSPQTELDFSIVAVEPKADTGRDLSAYSWIKLIADIGKIATGDGVNIIQHPNGGLKQIAFRENEVVLLPSGKPQYLYYSTDTEPGSSGSPCFNDQWELVALHHSSVPKMDNQGRILTKEGSIWHDGSDSSLVDWVANEGIRISAIVALLRSLQLGGAQRDQLNRVLGSTPPNPIERARSSVDAAPETPNQPSSAIPNQSPRNEANSMSSFTWNIPLQITVSMGNPVAATAAAPVPAPPALTAPAPAPVVETEAVVVLPDYENRPGYDPKFLGFSVPLPQLTDAMKVQTAQVNPDRRKHHDSFELTYYHYSVYMNKSRRTAWFSAANVDGRAEARFAIGKREGDRWYNDPRIPSDAQLDQSAFEHGIDRGHLTRREDTNWGTDVDSALKANDDTFHFTNCSLQASPFNRGKDRWQGLEQFLLEQHAKKDNLRLVVITGPVFSPSDPVYRNDQMSYSVRCPLQFWKVCVLQRQDGTPSATAFVLGQEDIADLPGFEAAFDVAAAQIDSHCWGGETGGPHWDVGISTSTMRRAMAVLLDRTRGYRIGRILYVIGNDLFHADSPTMQTTAGTPQDVDSRYWRTFLRMREMQAQQIEDLLTIAPVDVVMVPGNHDEQSAMHLGHALQCWFRHSAHVAIDNTPLPRKHWARGVNHIMLTHGHLGKAKAYPMLMATERPDLWAAGRVREIQCGHLHTRIVHEEFGVVMRWLPSLKHADRWHARMGYTGNSREAHAYLFDDRDGMVGSAIYNADTDMGVAA